MNGLLADVCSVEHMYDFDRDSVEVVMRLVIRRDGSTKENEERWRQFLSAPAVRRVEIYPSYGRSPSYSEGSRSEFRQKCASKVTPASEKVESRRSSDPSFGTW